MCLKGRIEFRELRDPFPDEAKSRERGFIALVQRGVGIAAETLQLFCVGEHAPGGQQLFVFTSANAGAIELTHLVLQKIETRGTLAFVELQRVELTLHAPPFSKRSGHAVAHRRETGKVVKERKMTLRIEQRLMLVLTVKFHETGCLILECRRRD